MPHLDATRLYAPRLSRPAAVMGDGGNIVDRFYLDPHDAKLPDCRFPPDAGALDIDMDFLQAGLEGFFGPPFQSRFAPRRAWIFWRP